MNYTKKAINGTLIIFVFSFLSAIFGYGLRLLLARELTIEEYGFVYAVMAFFGLFSLFQDLGLSSALVKYIAEFKIQEKYKLIKNSILTVFLIQVFSTFCFGVFFILMSDFFALNIFHNLDYSIYIKVFSVSIILSPILVIFKSIFQGFQKMVYFSLVDFLQFGLIFLITLVLLQFNFGLLSPFLAYVLVYVIGILFYYIFVKKVFPIKWDLKFKFDKRLTSKLVKFGIPVILTGAAGIIFSQTDTVLITLFRSLEEVGLYNASFPTARFFWGLSGTLTIILLPLSSELWAKEEFLKIKEGVELLYKYALIFILPISLLFLMFPELILNLLFGARYIAGSNVLRILGVGTIFYVISQINNSVLMGIGKPKLVSKIMLFAAGLNLVGNLILIPIYGIIGATISTVFAFLIVMFLSFQNLKKIVKNKFDIKNSCLIVFIGLLFLLTIYLTKTYLNTGIWFELISSVLIGGLIYFGGLFLFNVLEFKEIKQIMERLK